MHKRLLIIAIAMLLQACNQYTVVKNDAQAFGPVTVTPSGAWNRVPSLAEIGGAPTWTVNGRSLDSLTFFADIEDGEPLATMRDKDDMPIYKSDMLPDEIVELFESTIVLVLEASISSGGELKPRKIGTEAGFEYSFQFSTPDDVIRRGRVYGVVVAGKLNLFFYQAARMHYFKRSEPEVRTIIDSVQVL